MSKNRKPTVALPVRLLLGISFVEGAAVMIVELLGAKIIAPYYGVSLYVWSSVLGVTLGALALGYFSGGVISRKYPGERSLFTVLLIGAFFTAIAPLIAPWILTMTEPLGVQMGSLVSVLMFLLVPVACFGCVSPIITQQISKEADDAGRSAGTVYAVSTVGGILATFLSGFYLIPTIGIKATAYGTGGLLAVIALGYFAVYRRFLVVLIGIGLGVLTMAMHPSGRQNGDIRVIYSSIGILGEWMVLDEGDPSQTKGGRKLERTLTLNGIDQTYTQHGFIPLSLWKYPHQIAAYASIKPSGSKALLLGMGGGSIAFELAAIGLDLDIVELDERIGHIVETYFQYDPTYSDLYIDDARHYIRNTDKKYDVVVIDLLVGEVQPTHVFSVEGFSDLKEILTEDALVIINFQGTMMDPEFSRGPRSIYKTLLASGFNVHHFNSAEKSNGVTQDNFLTQDIFLLASLQEIDYKVQMADLRYNKVFPSYKWFPYDAFGYEDLISEERVDLEDAYLLVDDKPRLELLNSATILKWRKNIIEQNISRLMDAGIPIYD
jgi:predicted membrane-bound spermidine synthase